MTTNSGEALTDRNRSGNQARRQNILVYFVLLLTDETVLSQ